MNSILSIVCILFFAFLTHHLILGHNKLRHHKYDCRTLFIPEDFDIDTALQTVIGVSRGALEKRSLTLGATPEFVTKSSDVDLKIYIIQESISDKHILAMDIKDKIKERESLMKKERPQSIQEDIIINNTQQNTNVSIRELQEDFDETL